MKRVEIAIAEDKAQAHRLAGEGTHIATLGPGCDSFDRVAKDGRAILEGESLDRPATGFLNLPPQASGGGS